MSQSGHNKSLFGRLAVNTALLAATIVAGASASQLFASQLPHIDTSVPETGPADGYKVTRLLNIGEGRFQHGDFYWDDSNAPKDGEMLVIADLPRQTLTVFKGGVEIGRAVLMYGDTEKPTPYGIYPVTEKDADKVSNIYIGAPMPYAMRLNNDGIFVHGGNVRWGYGTYGCVSAPVQFAKLVFNQMKVGDKVMITNRNKGFALGERISRDPKEAIVESNFKQ